MSASQNLYEGLFASINEKDETTVTYLFYANTTSYLKRYNKEWLPVDNIDDENTNGDEQIPVTDEFIEAFDKSQEDGVPLSIDDANAYLMSSESELAKRGESYGLTPEQSEALSLYL